MRAFASRQFVRQHAPVSRAGFLCSSTTRYSVAALRSYATSCTWQPVESAPAAIDAIGVVDDKVCAVLQGGNKTLLRLDTNQWKWNKEGSINIESSAVKILSKRLVGKPRAHLLPTADKDKALYLAQDNMFYSLDMRTGQTETLTPPANLGNVRLARPNVSDKLWAFAKFEAEEGCHLAYWQQTEKTGKAGKWTYEHEFEVIGAPPERNLVAVGTTDDGKFLVGAIDHTHTHLFLHRFDQATLMWKMLASAPYPKEPMALSVFGKKVVVVGIEPIFMADWFKKRGSVSVAIYDLDTQEWENIPEGPQFSLKDIAAVRVGQTMLVYSPGTPKVQRLELKF